MPYTISFLCFIVMPDNIEKPRSSQTVILGKMLSFNSFKPEKCKMKLQI